MRYLRLFVLFFLFAVQLVAEPVLAFTPKAFDTLQIANLNMKMSSQEVERVLLSNGYKNIKNQTVRNLQVMTYSKTIDRKRYRVDLTYITREGKESIRVMAVSIPNIKGKDGLTSEVARLKSHMGSEIDKCSVKSYATRCRLKGKSDTNNLSFNFSGASHVFSYTFRSDYSPLIVMQNKIKKETASKYPCMKTMDVNDLDQVYNCLGSLRVQRGVMQGKNILEGTVNHSCFQARGAYMQFLMQNQMVSQQEWMKLMTNKGSDSIGGYKIPSCSMLAQVASEMFGKPAMWASCVDYKNNNAYIKKCLEGFIPIYHGNKNALKTQLKSCNQIRSALMIASKSANKSNGLPEGYKDPDCDSAMQAMHGGAEGKLAKSPCGKYDPMKARTHIGACLKDESQLSKMRNCADVRGLYEKKLTEAHGRLPENYLVMRCSYAKTILETAEKKRQENIVRMKEAQKRRAEVKRKRMEASNRYWNDTFKQGEKMMSSMKVKRGPLVSANMPPVHGGKHAGTTSRKSTGATAIKDDVFAEFEQADILRALYHGRFDALSESRRDIIIYLGTLGSTLGGDSVTNNFPRCRPYFSASQQERMQDEIIRSTGMDKIINGDPVQGGMKVIGASLSMLRDITTNGYGNLYQASRNIELLHKQAENDAYRFASSVGCGSAVSKQFKKNAVAFVNR